MLRVLAVDGEISTYSLREKYQELYNKSQLVKKAEEEKHINVQKAADGLLDLCKLYNLPAGSVGNRYDGFTISLYKLTEEQLKAIGMAFRS